MVRALPLRHCGWTRWLAAVLVLCWAVSGGSVPAVADPPNVDDVVRRMLERAESLPGMLDGTCLGCRRVTVIEELDSKGGLRERKTKEHLVALTGHEQTTTLVKIDGKVPTDSDRRREERREDGHREKFGPRRERAARPAQRLDRALLERFRYRLVGTEEVSGRASYVLEFEPARESADGKAADRILGSLRGRLWVDADEFEPVRIEASLRDSVSIAGFVAVLDEFDMTVVRRRLSSGQWVDERVDTRIGGRKFIQRFRGHMEVTQEEFTVTPIPAKGLEGPATVPASP